MLDRHGNAHTALGGGARTWIMNRMMGFLGSTCTGLTPSSTPPCGGALGAAVAVAARDDMGRELAGKERPAGSCGRRVQ